MPTVPDIHRRGTRAAQAGLVSLTVGTLYFVTDEGVTERWNGTTWDAYSGVTPAAHHTTHELGGSDVIAGVAQLSLPNTFTDDQTIEGNLIVTGEINPARWAAQRTKVAALEGAPAPAAGVRTLLSETLVAGMSLRHDDASSVARITVGNYDTLQYQPLVVEVESTQFHTGVSPAARVEHVRVHPSGGVTVGVAAAHATDPGTGVLVAAAGLGTTPIPVATVGPLAAGRVVGRGSGAGAGALEPLTVGPGLVLQGTVLSALNSSVFAYQFSTNLTEPPSNQTVRFNAPHPYTAVTKVWADYDSSASEDLYWAWQRVQVGSLVLVQDKDNHLQWGEVRTTGAPIDRGSYVELPCVWASNGTALATQDVLVRVTLTTSALTARLDALEARLRTLEGA